MVKVIIQTIVAIIFVRIPSLIYGISAELLTPVAWLLRLFVGRPVFSYTAGIMALKLDTIFVLLIVPAILFIFTWKPLGVIFFVWMALYLLIRIYSGVHEKEKIAIDAMRHLDALEKKGNHIYVKYNMAVTAVTICLTLASPVAGYYIGGEKGLWIGIALSAVIWLLSPFARETIIDKSNKD